MPTKIFLIGFLSLLAFSCKKENNIPPNIVFIMSDDHAYQAVSAYGYGLNNTPNIDRIAQEGALFQKGFVTNSICAPSRAVMLTGKHSFVNGKVDNVQDFNWNQDNFAKHLQKAGYQTALIGKIHLRGLPQGFDYSAVLPGQGHYYNPDFIIDGVKEQIKGYVTTITKISANKNSPFYCCTIKRHHTATGNPKKNTSPFLMTKPLIPPRIFLMIIPTEELLLKPKKCLSLQLKSK
jgi:arylsulfatase A-like enzyme